MLTFCSMSTLRSRKSSSFELTCSQLRHRVSFVSVPWKISWIQVRSVALHSLLFCAWGGMSGTAALVDGRFADVDTWLEAKAFLPEECDFRRPFCRGVDVSFASRLSSARVSAELQLYLDLPVPLVDQPRVSEIAFNR